MTPGPKPKDYFPNDKATHDWLNSQDKPTRNVYQTAMKQFQEFVRLTGDAILRSREMDIKNKTHDWERKVLAYKNWLMETKGIAPYTATTRAMAIRGFFAHHYMRLEYRRSERKRLSDRTRKTEDYRFTREELKKMADVADLTEKYVVVAGKSFGLRAGDFLRLRRGDVESYLDREPPICIGPLGTQKESVKGYPFIDTDLLPILKLKLERMTRDGRTDSDEKVLKYKHEKQLSRILRRVAERAGVESGIKRIRFHCLRKFLIDHLSSVMSESKWKQIVGKKISEGAYVSSDSLRADYARAMSEICFSESGDKTKLKEDLLKEVFRQQAKAAGYDDDSINRIIVRCDADKVWLLRRKLMRGEPLTILKDDKDDDDKCSSGEDCQKVVCEDDLEKFLGEGWKVVTALPSGKVVISNE